MDVASFHAQRRFVSTPSGRIAYVEQGAGPVALFIHGVPLNGFHWRHVMGGVRDLRRCIALDLMGLGYTEIAPDQDVSFTAQARMIGEFLDALGIERIDLIGNDSGGAICQLFACQQPHRLASLTLTNCDTHDNWPPEQIGPALELARAGRLADVYGSFGTDPALGRQRLARSYVRPEILTDEILQLYFAPIVSTPERKANFNRYWASFDAAQTVAIEPKLRALKVPTLILWALEDIFFDVKWAHWLKATIPGATKVVEVPKGKLFFTEDCPESVIPHLRAHLLAAA